MHFLIFTHDARGCVAPEGECVHIRQSTSAYVIAATNMLHFQHCKICHNMLQVQLCIETLDGFECVNEF